MTLLPVIPAKAGIPLLLRAFASLREQSAFGSLEGAKNAKASKEESGIPAFAGMMEEDGRQ
jgi:hypothetical protein